MYKQDCTPILVDNFRGAFKSLGEPRSLRMDEAQTFFNLVLFGNGAFGSRPGYTQIATTLATSSPITGLFPLIRRDGDNKLCVTYEDKVTYWDESTDTWASAIHTRTNSGNQSAGVSYDDKLWITNPGTGADDHYASYDGTTYTEYSANPHGTMIALHKQRACVAGVTAALQTMYYSATSDLTDFTYSSPRVAGEGGVIAFPEWGDNITSLVTRDYGSDLESPVYVFKGSSIWTVDWQTVTLAGGTEDDFPVRSLLKSNTGASYARSAYFGNNVMVYADETFKQIRQLGYEANFTDQRTRDLTQSVRNTAKYYVFDEAAGIWFKNKYYMACKTSDASFNNRVLVFDADYPTQETPAAVSVFDWPVNCWSIYNNDLYFGASDSGNVYKALQLNDDADAAISCSYESGDLSFGLPYIGKQCKAVYIEGYMTEVSEIDIKSYHDFEEDETWSVTLNGTGNYVSQNADVSLGANSLGTAIPLGGGAGGDEDTEYKPFFIEITTARKRFYRQRLTIESSQAGGAWIINSITYWVKSLDPKYMPTNHQT